MGRVETRKKQKKEAAETKFRTRKEQERGAVGEKNMRLGNPGKTISGKFSRPDDASITRTKKEEEQARDQRFIAPTQNKIRSELGQSFGEGAGSVDFRTKKQIVSKDRDIPTRKQEKERTKLAKSKPKKMMGGGMTKIKYRGGGIVSRSRPTKYI
jgi:hypothetical protein|tara:strand:+ start:455 stop:919 length:465 start_codon:yes stop_codon:yes gene_type:complete